MLQQRMGQFEATIDTVGRDRMTRLLHGIRSFLYFNNVVIKIVRITFACKIVINYTV